MRSPPLSGGRALPHTLHGPRGTGDRVSMLWSWFHLPWEDARGSASCETPRDGQFLESLRSCAE